MNAKESMNSLEALEEIRERFSDDAKNNNSWGFNISKQLQAIKQDLEVLEILKDKKVDIGLVDYTTLECYNSRFNVYSTDRLLTKDEFDLLKKWLDE